MRGGGEGISNFFHGQDTPSIRQLVQASFTGFKIVSKILLPSGMGSAFSWALPLTSP